MVIYCDLIEKKIIRSNSMLFVKLKKVCFTNKNKVTQNNNIYIHSIRLVNGIPWKFIL